MIYVEETWFDNCIKTVHDQNTLMSISYPYICAQFVRSIELHIIDFDLYRSLVLLINLPSDTFDRKMRKYNILFLKKNSWSM